ncbi:hypothetical protein SAMN04488065_2136 [Haloplanus vescus]|uniref:Uncharacterized protein n=1 Tax=Haloplanus vescus TaxID=555874 RepID=A0A1H3Z3J9_9EURY|nr:hypothetical protein [Haloplanus vescus]SEA18349.1 hypothetical protein SAMN04488065_2136 [Haloplanus vescus]
MAAVSDLNQWGTETGGQVSDARVALGTAMVVTIAAVAAAGEFLGPAAAGQAAAAMLPVVAVTMFRAPLDSCSIYASLR